MAGVSATIEVQYGPWLQTCVDVADYAEELIDLIPCWHVMEHEEMTQRLESLKAMLAERLEVQ